MRFSELVKKHYPNPYDRTEDKPKAITRLTQFLYKDLEAAVISGGLPQSVSRQYVDLNEVIKSVGGDTLKNRRSGADREIPVEDFEVTDKWAEEYFSGKRVYGEREAAKPATSSSPEYEALKEAVAAAKQLKDSATKKDTQEALTTLLDALEAYGSRIPSLKGVLL